MLHGIRHIDSGLFAGTLLEVIVGDQPSLASSISNHNASLFQALDVALVVAADSVADGNEREFVLIKDVAAVGG